MSAVDHPFFEQAWPDGEYRMFQIGVVVDDIFAACGDWARVFGIGPFHVFPRIETACWYRGTDTAVDLQIAVAQAGPVQIELIQQHCDRPSVYRELAGAGSRIHQLCAITSDYHGKKARYESLGYPLVSEMVVRGHLRRIRLLHRAGRGRPRLRRRAHPRRAHLRGVGRHHRPGAHPHQGRLPHALIASTNSRP